MHIVRIGSAIVSSSTIELMILSSIHKRSTWTRQDLLKVLFSLTSFKLVMYYLMAWEIILIYVSSLIG